MIQKQNLRTFLVACLKIEMDMLNDSKENIAIGFLFN